MTMYSSVGHLDSYHICSLKVFLIDTPSRSPLKLLNLNVCQHNAVKQLCLRQFPQRASDQVLKLNVTPDIQGGQG